jgi:exonuclease-1
MKKTKLLIDAGIIPLIVFDGGDLPMKEETKNARRKTRAQMMDKGNEYMKLGNISNARECFNSAVSVTPEMYLLFTLLGHTNGSRC